MRAEQLNMVSYVELENQRGLGQKGECRNGGNPTIILVFLAHDYTCITPTSTRTYSCLGWLGDLGGGVLGFGASREPRRLYELQSSKPVE